MLGLREEAYLTSLMYSRPEAWLSWHTSRPVDRPLKSLLHVALLGLRGLVFVPPLAVFSRGPSRDGGGSVRRPSRRLSRCLDC